jgi:hypothetical protein
VVLVAEMATVATVAETALAVAVKVVVEEETAVEKAASSREAVEKVVQVISAAGKAKVVEEKARYPQAKPLKYTLHRSIFLKRYRLPL